MITGNWNNGYRSVIVINSRKGGVKLRITGVFHVMVASGLVATGCLFSSDSEIVHYTGQVDLGFEITQIINNECVDNEISIHWALFEDNFYLIESLEHLDSLEVYYEFEWTPRLEEFFPEDGMLLLYSRSTDYEVSYINHSITLYGTTVFLDLALEEFDVDNPVPGIRGFIVPIGIVPAE